MTKKQASVWRIISVACVFLLAACESLPQINLTGMKGGNFQPLSSDVAMMAAPQASSAAAPLYCVAGLGSAHMARGWVDFEKTSFVLPSGGKAQVVLKAVRGGGSMTVQGYFDVEGQKIIFCPVIDAPPDERISCSSLYALDDDLQMGIKRTFDVPDAVRGGAISCAYSKDKIRKF